ncbi:MAG: glycosyltransferase family 4 protein, partial [Candidatus Methylomirabilales bacterium]
AGGTGTRGDIVRVLMVCPSYPPQEVTCGVGDYTRCLVEELTRQGEDVSVLCSSQYLGTAQGPVHVLPLVRRWTLDQALRLSFSQAMPRGEILHLQYTPHLYGRGAGFKLLPLLTRLRVRGPATVVTFHTLTAGSGWSRVWAMLLLASAHHSISANEEVTTTVRRRLPRLSRRLTEIPIGANVPVAPLHGMAHEAGRRLLGVPPDIPLLVHFGLVYAGKGLETMFAALPDLLRFQPGIRLVIVGDTRPDSQGYRATLDALAVRLGIAHATIWAGRRCGEEVSQILQAADLFVVPYDDGISIRRGSLMAGLAHSLPVVSTTSSLASAYLRDGDNITLVPPRNPQALSARIASLLCAPDEAARLGQGARKLADRFTWPVIARETRELYARVLQRCGSWS